MKSAGNLLVLCGATVGGILGYFVFYWCVRQGISVLAAPGGLLGLGAGVARGKSTGICVLCGIAGLALGIFSEWRLFPFVADDRLSYFILHVHQLTPMTWISILMGTVIAFWVPFRRREMARQAGPAA